MKTISATIFLLLTVLCATAQTNIIQSTIPNNTSGTSNCKSFKYKSFANVLGSTNQSSWLFGSTNIVEFQFTNSGYQLFWITTAGAQGCGFGTVRATNSPKFGYRLSIFATNTLPPLTLPVTTIGFTNPP